MEYNPNNIFAKIIRGEVPANVVLEDEHAISFYDIMPKADVHIVALPKLACTDFEDFMIKTSGDVEYFFNFIIATARKVALTDYRLVTNKGQYAGQSVFHFHMHILSGNLSETF